MRVPHFIAYSCGASHLCTVHLKMTPSGRCDLIDFRIDEVELSSSEPLLWLKALSDKLFSAATSFKADYPAGFVIPGHVALAKYLRIPQTKGSRKQKIVAFEARQNIPYPIEEVTWGSAEVQEDALDFEVLLGAARTEIVEAVVRYSKEAKINLQGIAPATAALINGVRFNYPDREGCVALLSIGAKSTDIVILDGNRHHARAIPFGGQSVTVEMAENLDLSLAEAERAKREIVAESPVAPEIEDAFALACRSFQRRLVTECARTRALAERSGSVGAPALYYLTGGGSLLPRLGQVLESKLGAPTRIYDPLRKIHVEDEELARRTRAAAPFLADAIGLGVGRFLPDAVTIDLTPRSLLWQRRFRHQQPFYLLAGIVACGAVGLPLFNTSLEIQAYEQEIHNLDSQIRPLSQLNQAIHDRTTQIKRMQEVIEKAGATAELRTSWVRLLNDLQERLVSVEDVWLDKLKLIRPEEPAPRGAGFVRVRKPDTRSKLQLEGRLIDVRNPMSSVSPESYRRVKELLESFRHSEFVASLEDERFDYSTPGILRFDFTLVVKEEARL